MRTAFALARVGGGEIDRLKGKRASWNRDRKIRSAKSEAHATSEKLAAATRELLQVKPLLEVKQGTVSTLTKVRTQSRARAELIARSMGYPRQTQPTTSAGKVAHYFVIVVQPGLMALITGAIASQLVQLVLKRNAGLGRAKVKNHIVICGWSAKGEAIIREIRGRDDLDKTQPLVVLAPLTASPTKDEFTTFVSGDPSNEEDLKRAGIDPVLVDSEPGG